MVRKVRPGVLPHSLHAAPKTMTRVRGQYFNMLVWCDTCML
jgi:hypothetical protein